MKFEKQRTSIIENSLIFGIHYIVEISSVFCNVYVVPWNQKRIIFYVNNYIDQNQFNQLFNSSQLKKDIQNVDTIAHKIEPALKKATNLKLEEARKKQEVIKKRKIEPIASK